MTTLEELLKTKITPEPGVTITPNFRVSVQTENENGVVFIIHPDGHDGETLDFLVQENDLIPL